MGDDGSKHIKRLIWGAFAGILVSGTVARVTEYAQDPDSLPQFHFDFHGLLFGLVAALGVYLLLEAIEVN